MFKHVRYKVFKIKIDAIRIFRIFFFLNSSWIMLDGGKKCDVLTFEIPVYVEIIGEWFTGEAGFRKIPGNRGVLHFELDR